MSDEDRRDEDEPSGSRREADEDPQEEETEPEEEAPQDDPEEAEEEPEESLSPKDVLQPIRPPGEDRPEGPVHKPSAGLTVAEGEDGGDEPEIEEVPEPDLSEEEARRRRAPTQLSDEETKKLLKDLGRMEDRQRQAELAEAKQLRRQAEELEKKAEERKTLKKDIAAHQEYVRQVADRSGLDPERPVTEVPDLDEPQLAEVELIPIDEDRSYVRIVYDRDSSRYHYRIIEPQLSSTEEEVREFLQDTLIRTLDGRYKGQRDWEAYLGEEIERAIVDHSVLVDEISKERIKYYLVRDFLGYGPIDVMMKDPMIEDVSCDGPGIPIYVFHRQYESIRTNVVFEDEYDLDSFVLKLAQRAGKHISIANPLLDATLPDKSRLQCTLGREVTTRGSSFTIRRFRTDPLTPADLVRLGTLSPELGAYLWLCMEEGNSVIFAGGTASGKTTTLNAACQFIPPQKKIVSLEDTREINLEHENWIAGLTRTGFGGEVIEGKVSGTIDMYELLEAALRQRPEYLLVGEVRGEEALTLFQAMATGHSTYSTLHADSVMSAVYRLENPPINVPRTMIQQLDVMAIQVQARIDKRMVRRIKEVVEIVDIDPDTGDLLTNTVFRWDPEHDHQEWLGKSDVFERIRTKNNLKSSEILQEWRDRALVLEWMVEKGIRQSDDVASVISAYYSSPGEVLRRVREAMGDVAEVEEPVGGG